MSVACTRFSAAPVTTLLLAPAGTDSIYRLVYLALLYIAGQDDEGEVTDDHEECLLLLLQLPGAQGLSADDIADLITHCWDLKVRDDAWAQRRCSGHAVDVQRRP